MSLCQDHHAQVHNHLAKISKQRGYLVSGNGWVESREALRAVRKAYGKAPAPERLGLIAATSPAKNPPNYAPRRPRSAANR